METSILHKAYRGKRFDDLMDMLRALPSNIVSDIIYPLAVRVIKDRNHLIEVVDIYRERNHNSYLCRRYPIGMWDLEPVIDFSRVFDAMNRNRKLQNFNEDVSSWNVANGTNLSCMFSGCIWFNSDVSRWNVANATNLSSMFEGCRLFNSDVSRWNVANATNLSGMFSGCKLFNSDVSRWNVASATNLSGMFSGCKLFNSDVSGWNVANSTNLSCMFSGCVWFRSDVS
jgi:surface protein